MAPRSARFRGSGAHGFPSHEVLVPLVGSSVLSVRARWAAHSGARQSSEDPNTGAMTHHTILVVDDSPTSILWQRLILEGERYRVITARDGEEGVRTALAERPDLILMDVVMPN